MNAKAPQTEATAPMRGEIQAQTIPELLADLDARQVTGTLVVTTGGVRRTVQLQPDRGPGSSVCLTPLPPSFTVRRA